MRVNSFFISSAAAVSIATVVALSSIVDATAGTKATPAPAAAQVHAQAPGVYRYRVGDFQVTALSDGTVPQDLHALLTNTTPVETDGSLKHAFLSNPVEASINAFLIDTGARLLLVDTGNCQSSCRFYLELKPPA